MINPKGKKLEKLLFGIFDEAIQGVDRYNHNGSMWLIFTDEMRWVVEYTKEQTLWYNYHLFKQEMEIIGLDCVENKNLIQKWFESRFLNINPVEDTIQNGVKHIKKSNSPKAFSIDNTIQNGVIHTSLYGFNRDDSVEDTIQNGVIHTDWFLYSNNSIVEDTIQNGVKETTPSGYLGSIEMKGKVVHQIESPKQNNEVEDTIQNGVKETHERSQHHEFWVKDTIQNGVKHCEDGDWLDGDERFEDIIQNGTK
jgi:hypothetical protein